jgi:archaellum component FlaC
MEDNKISERLGILETKVENMENEIKDLKSLISEIHEMSLNIVLMTEQIKCMNGDISGLKDDVQKIQEAPAGKWDLIVKTIITGIVSAVVAYIITMIK